MKISIVPIGNSRGIRLPKSYFDELNIQNDVDVEIKNKQIVLSPIKNCPRKGWEQKFKEMHEKYDDSLLISDELDISDIVMDW